MLFLFILGIIAILIGLIIAIANWIDQEPTVAAIALVVGGIIGAIIIAFSCARKIPTGHTGVVTNFGRVENYTLDSGIHFMAPWKKVVKMDNRVQKETVSLSCFSSDIQEVTMVYTVNFQISKADAMTIYSTIGKDYYAKVITPSVMESVKVVAARYTAEELVATRNELALAIEEDVSEKLLSYNIEVVSTSIEDMDFTDAFTNAVEAKQVAAQNKLKAETEAAQKVVEAEAAAEVKRIQAEADAYELKTRSEAEAEANRKIAESLTDELIDYTYATGWDGKLPNYMTGENSIPVFNGMQ